ncbi:sigma factor [Kutzneria sp. NPDC051319]|uniref:RNA polymerase sigma factor n=1 Tax=Kutzneria sp. NPDC051319 TaxID=3155047 RepID=UPI00342B4CFD
MNVQSSRRVGHDRPSGARVWARPGSVGCRFALFAAAYGMTRSPTDAEDLAQETCLKAHSSRAGFQGNDLQAQPNRILADTFANAYRARRIRPTW